MFNLFKKEKPFSGFGGYGGGGLSLLGGSERQGNKLEGGDVETSIIAGATKTGILAFNSPGTVTISKVISPFTLEITVVGGGGAGGGHMSWQGAGGGGAGSVVTSSIPISPPNIGQTFSVSIGAGGAPSSNPGSPSTARPRGGPGGNTVLTKPSPFGGPMTAYGGAGGGSSARPQTNPAPAQYVPGGDSSNASAGGGGSRYTWSSSPGGSAPSPGGHPGGDGGPSAPGNGGGGGGGGGFGGSGNPGYEAYNPQTSPSTGGWSGPGGIGVQIFGGIDIPQADGAIGGSHPSQPGRWVAGGGTGSGNGPADHKAGGFGGGGEANDGNAQANTGGGGGGGSDGGTGGAGLVVFKYVVYS